jgi:Spy/CpxP family protein refolding chaperone
MRCRRFVVIVALVAACWPRPAQAQTPAQGFRWWQDEKMKAELGLTPEQVVKLEAVFQERLPRLTAGKELLDSLERQLNIVVRDANVSEAEVLRQVNTVEVARSALGTSRTLLIYRLYRNLTPEQRAKMKAMHEKWEAERRKNDRR